MTHKDGHDATLELLTDSAPAGSGDEDRRRHDLSPPADDELLGERPAGALDVLRRGVAVTPELRAGLVLTVVMALATAGGKLAIPIAIQQILSRGVLGDSGFRPGFVYSTAAISATTLILLFVVSRATYLRLVRTAEDSLFGLRTRTFGHIHKLSVAELTENRRGALVARVTSDIETLARFTEWGAVSWIVNSALIVGTLLVMIVYSWQLTLLVVVIFVPLVPLLRVLQQRQLVAYDDVRTTVGTTLSEVSEAVTGASVIRAYGIEQRAQRRLSRAMDDQYRAHLKAARYFALMFPLGDLFGSVALAATVAVGAWWGPEWGLSSSELIAFAFLVNLLLSPVAELSEILDQTQTAIAGWRKVLDVLELPIDVIEPDDGLVLPDGPLGVDVNGLSFAYRTGDIVLRGIDVEIPAATSVAVVGETGSGKTTFAKLLCRLADPTAGEIRVGGVSLDQVAPVSRRRSIRLVPQDGFLFDASVLENVRMGRPGASDDSVRAAFEQLDLGWWIDGLPDGLETRVGERGGSLSVGERQLVALTRAQLGDPGLLILDEATSAIDPETELALSGALARLAEGRTVISIAHRLSTAEAAELVLVFDGGRIVEVGSHDELVTRAGVYAALHQSWLGATRSVVDDPSTPDPGTSTLNP